ncbi:hypothetical protein KDN34_02840 [Shewanella yunxiaonensis]|uniref:Lipoprotein n=1 Tax=Shewanella yunxiaonensis TaxID=2829809 RepID=A0ABX7YUI6_9GAMM|nr:hypothetical protein [Shewanella yunxiaonensis]QUN06418.1 hypothetical protein KDN34_02840 [Shewanella yunxiaonensis]
MRKNIIYIWLFTLLGACNSTPAPQTKPLADNDSVPNWVFTPTQENGLASSSCVAWAGNMAAARAQAIANAKADLTLQIETRAKVLDKVINSQQQNNQQMESHSSFTQVSKQVAQQSLIGAIPKEVVFAQIDNQKQLCAFVILENSKNIFDKLINQASVSIDPQSEQALFKEFQMKKTIEELESELNN